jgi:hypothetical protein
LFVCFMMKNLHFFFKTYIFYLYFSFLFLYLFILCRALRIEPKAL